MPTGYTAAVADGTIDQLRPFVLQLARGMGALIMMRDEPWDTPIPERFEPSRYSADALAEVTAKRDRVTAMTADECSAAAAEGLRDYEARFQAWLSEKQAIRLRYTHLIEQVHAWEGAPEGIKEFALEQLQSGLEFDSPAQLTFYEDRPGLDGEEWRLGALEELNRLIAYHAKAWAEEVERVEGRNLWLARLRKSLDAFDQQNAAAVEG